MKQKLLNAAFISSPIFAVYAVSHPLIFGVVRFPMVLFPLVGLIINIFILWLINIYITLRFPHLSIWKKAFYSYGFNISFQVLFALIGYFFRISRPLEQIESFYLHPVITSIAINVIIIIICNSIEASYRRNEAEFKAKELEYENSEAQKKLLIQQLQPHFLFNALSVLKSLIKENTNDAEEYIVKLADFLRYSVQSHQSETVSLEEELAFVNDYIELQKVRFEDSFQYVVNVPNEVKTYKIPVFALQTLLENAFKHNHFTDKKPLRITINYENENLKIWNNKVITKIAMKTSTGLKNLNRRYELIANKNIVVNDSADSFEVIIPLI
jgi:two-component system, LytTR family, sensor kinase